MELQWSSEKGSLLIDEGTWHKQPHAHAEIHKHTPISLNAKNNNVLWEALAISPQHRFTNMDNIGVIKIRERTSNIYLQFYHTENITGNGWERGDLIRPLLIKVIGHSASQECNWPIAVNLLSLSLLLSPKLLIYCWASFPNDTREEFSLVPNKELIISNCSRKAYYSLRVWIGFLDKHSQFVLLWTLVLSNVIYFACWKKVYLIWRRAMSYVAIFLTTLLVLYCNVMQTVQVEHCQLGLLQVL